jgi:hypothetical protein
MRHPNRLWAMTKIALNVTMGLLYLYIGYFIIEKQWFMTDLDQRVSYSLGGVLIVYGLFRVYRIIRN